MKNARTNAVSVTLETYFPTCTDPRFKVGQLPLSCRGDLYQLTFADHTGASLGQPQSGQECQ